MLSADGLEPAALGWRGALKALMPLALLAVLVASPYWFVWLRWSDENDYYTHGPLIPFVSAYLVLRKRKELTGEAPPDLGSLYAGGIGAAVLYFLFREMEWSNRVLFAILCSAAVGYVVYSLRRLQPQPYRKGLFLLVPALAGCAIAGVQEIVSVGWFFSVLLVAGLVLYYLGKRVTRVLIFPLIFLFASAPMPEYVIQRVALPLKLFATGNSTRILRGMGLYCEQEGSRIEFERTAGGEAKEVTVGAPCSGLRSLIALITFGLLFAYITPLSTAKKVILFLATIPASFIANLIRILVLALITYRWNAEIATGAGLWDVLQKGPLESMVPQMKNWSVEPVHDVTGILVFVIAFIGLFALERLLTYIERRQHADEEEPGDAAPEGAHD